MTIGPIRRKANRDYRIRLIDKEQQKGVIPLFDFVFLLFHHLKP